MRQRTIMPFTGELKFAAGSPNDRFATVETVLNETDVKLTVSGLPTVTVEADATVGTPKTSATAATTTDATPRTLTRPRTSPRDSPEHEAHAQPIRRTARPQSP